MPITSYQKSCYYVEIFDALQLLLVTALDSTNNHVVQCLEENLDALLKQKATNFSSVVAITDGGGDFPVNQGAGRLDTAIVANINLRVFTRRHTDINNASTYWVRQHYPVRLQVINAVQDRFLYSLAPDLPWLSIAPDGDQLTAWPMECSAGQPRVRKDQADHSWGESNIVVKVPFRLRLDAPPA